MVGLAWCRLPVVSTSDLQLQTITTPCQSFLLSSHFKATSSVAFSAEYALLRAPVGACQRWKTFSSLATIMSAPQFRVPSVVKSSV